ncbi:predicted protein [Naegleria gruberi]|uniref:Predicted protein n=1 Tax=Naegleria gruberi TaxID=5762 RepID=D2VEF0_NAEGR|nr:uncharacterized protein NAEGRDRAFT_48880 [Naegleria gruberi]EFC44865.1 predicted protein [Naegleria gruberi]|eukprot:XP_002677609.1 predicted protein [Naegleria gruberi strain NEG-M]
MQATRINLFLSALALVVLIISQFYTPFKSSDFTTIPSSKTIIINETSLIDLSLLEQDCHSQLIKNFYFVQALTEYKNGCASDNKYCGVANLDRKIDAMISRQLEKSLNSECGNLVIHHEQVVPILKKEVDHRVYSICRGSTKCMSAVFEVIIYMQVFEYANEKTNLNTQHIRKFMETKASKLFDEPDKVSQFIRTVPGLEGYSGFDISVKTTMDNTDDEREDKVVTSIIFGIMVVLMVMQYKSLTLEQTSLENRIDRLNKDLESANQRSKIKQNELKESRDLVASLKDTIANLEQKFEEAKTEARTQNSNLERLDEQYKTSTTKLHAESAKEKEAAKKKEEELSKKVSSLTEKNRGLDKDLSLQKKEATSLKEKLENEIQQLKTESQKKENEVQIRHNNIFQELKKVTKEKERSTERSAELERETINISEIVTKLKGEVSSLREENENSAKIIDTKNTKISELKDK